MQPRCNRDLRRRVQPAMTTSIDGGSLAPPPVELVRGASLFLDFDGTLVELAARPDEVVVDAPLAGLIGRLTKLLGGRVAILTGRSATVLQQLIEPARLIIGGSHGLELRGVADAQQPVRHPSLDGLVSNLRELERRFPGVLIEDKPLGVAVHFRQAPDAEEACRSAVEQASRSTGLEVQPGKMVFELRPSGGDKGAALRRIMERPEFAGTRPVFLGDDLTDEPGFEAARALGGTGVLVGETRETAAEYRLETVADAVAWLSEAAEAIA